MSDDDDLPVLTQVLLTASGRSPLPGPADRSPASDGRIEPLLQRPLVIGNDPADAPSVVFDPRRPTLHDLFSSSSPIGDDDAPDHPAHDDLVSGFDEPPIDHRSGFEDPVFHEADAFTTAPPMIAGSFANRPLLASSEQERAIADTVREDVLEQLAARIDTELDARIAQTIRVELDTAIAHLQARLRGELSEALRDVVGNAVEEAIARRRGVGGFGPH